MKKVLHLTIAITCAVAASAGGAGYEDEYNALLKKYLTADGVRYAAWKSNASDVARFSRILSFKGPESPMMAAKEGGTR